MHQLTGKKNKVIVYLLLFFILSTTSNKTIQIQHNYPKEIIKIEVLGLSEENNLKIKKELNNLLLKNIFLINTNTINNVMSKYKLIQSYNVKKKYPSKLNIEIEQTKFIARIKSSKNYLIGTVIETNYLSSRVLLITDLNSKIPAVIQDTDVNVILAGNGNKNDFILEYLPENFVLEPNKIIFTSGKDGFLKSGMPIAETYFKNDKIKIRSLTDPQQASIVHITRGQFKK